MMRGVGINIGIDHAKNRTRYQRNLIGHVKTGVEQNILQYDVR